MKISREIKTALLILGALALLIWGIMFLNGKNLLSSNPVYYVEYDNVDGLNTASPVTVNGLVIGKVNKIELQPNGKLMVELLLNQPVEITKSSKAVLASSGLLSGKQVILDIDYKNPEILPENSYIEADAKSGLLDGLGEKADPLIEKMNALMASINGLSESMKSTLDDATKSNLQNAIAELNGTMKNANEITSKFKSITNKNEQKIGSMLHNFEHTSSNLSTFSDGLNHIQIEKVQSAINDFNTASAKLNAMISDIDQGKGNVGRLLKDETLYNNIEETSKQLKQLVEDIKLNPNRYLNISVFSKKQPSYQEPKQ